MKTIYLILFFILGLLILIAGCMFKIMHWPSATLLIIVGTACLTAACLLTVWKISTKK